MGTDLTPKFMRSDVCLLCKEKNKVFQIVEISETLNEVDGGYLYRVWSGGRFSFVAHESNLYLLETRAWKDLDRFVAKQKSFGGGEWGRG